MCLLLLRNKWSNKVLKITEMEIAYFVSSLLLLKEVTCYVQFVTMLKE